jgi:alkanesulfonate monooxygenase SsuD/methylene tetrahydromethanopterin reductase-like flavin-dependent oxidoreductase (luciferase family)
MRRPVIGLSVSVAPVGDRNPAYEASEAERLGFDFISVADHPFGSSPTNEPWVTLAWIGASTTTIGLVTRVLGVPFRSPALVAKMAENLDRLSHGRLVLGLGGGGADNKMRSVGITPPSAGEKIDALAEATAVIGGLWSESSFTYRGEHFDLERAGISPRPHHQIPIWMGVLGPRGAFLAGRLADGWIPHLHYTSRDRLRECRRRVAAGAESADRDPALVRQIVSVEVHIGALPNAPRNAIVGPPEAIAENLSELLDIGFDGFNISMIGPDRAEQPSHFVEGVLPMLSADRVRTT